MKLKAFPYKLFVLSLWIGSCEGVANELVYIPRAWHSVKELLSTAQEQTGIVLRCNLDDTLGKMVLYDNLTDLGAVREAALEYYVYVLGKNVEWHKLGRDWVLEPNIQLDAPIAVSLPALEDLWRQRLEQVALELEAQKAKTLAQSSAQKAESLQAETAMDPVSDNTQLATVDELPPPWIDEPLPENAVSRQWADRALYMMGHWWQSASSKERFALRHLWRNNDAMGRVPLMALVLAGKIDFNMGSDTPLSDLKIRSENFSMGPSPADLETPSTGIASGSSGLTALEDLPSSGNTAPIDTQTTDDSKAKNQPWHWPKHIVSFSPKNWWQILLGQRVDHPEEAAIPKVNPHVLERRDQARRVFDEVSDSLQEKREMSQPRRDKE